MTDTPAPSFWRGLFTGADNITPAIGRVLGAVLGLTLVIALLVSLPATIAAVLVLQHWNFWHGRRWSAIQAPTVGSIGCKAGTIRGRYRGW